ncbi:SDR family NAD(P)-dependent oxidoreductase [Actinocrispum wychmicini]|uniref:Beta-ketoacyl synthase-like protein n=1 Tax=Actinocrispum wychmicini TaxID=1213861 RepID=A0A4R2IPI7_9PSEU|nr:SDR family NAD(P)-dependent oxidoreductase [Actinocrispum wychmicini]TCO45908.1 beta-ketoacyl synthase-like protein [Actinocrispum wychmicini]
MTGRRARDACVAPVAVVGYGLAIPGASSPDEFWSVLHQQTSQFGPPERFDIDAMSEPGESVPDRVGIRVGGFLRGFRPHAKIAAEQGLWQDGDEECLWLRHSLLQCLDTCAMTDGARAGCYVGAWTGGSMALEDGLLCASVARELAGRLADDAVGRQRHEKRLRDLLAGHFRCAPHDLREALPHEIVRRAFTGVLPDTTDWLTVGAACASALYAIDLGIQSLYEGTCDVAFCGGVNGLCRAFTLMGDRFHGVSPTSDVRSFDVAANGTVFSDGAAVLALKRLNRAVADGDRILGVLSRPGLSSDGRGRAIAAPNPAGVRLAIQRGWQAAGLGDAAVDWVVAHGTGTLAGDAAEIEVLSGQTVAGELTCSSNKSVIGHTGWVSGAVSVIHVLLALRHQTIPAQQRFTDPNQALVGTRVHVPRTAFPWTSRADRPRTAGVSSMGIGGVNGHVVVHDRLLGGEPLPPAFPADDPVVLVGWSARVPGEGSRQRLEDWLRTGTGAPERSFGPHYSGPPVTVSRLSPTVTDVMDRGQLLALDVSGRFVAEHGELWADLRDTTGVIGAQSGLPRALHDTMIRAGSAELANLLSSGDDHEALSAYLDTVRTRQGVTEDSFTAATPSVAVNRIANRWDLHGPIMTIDTGPDSSQSALRTARRYLADGRLDLVLLLAINANAEQEAAWCCGRPEGQLAEGAFLLALARESFARERGWTIVAPVNHPAKPASGDTFDYYGAQGVVDLLRRALDETLGADTRRWATSLRRTDPKGYAAAEPDPFGSPAGLPRRGVVLVGSALLAEQLAEQAREAETLLISTDPLTDPHPANVVAELADERDVAPLLSRLDAYAPHLRVLLRVQDATRPWPAEAPELTRLLEMAVLCLKRLHVRIADGQGSAAAIILDPLGECLPHPETALFTGFFRSLALELPRERVCALVTDATVSDALDLFAAEATTARDRCVVHYRAGLRYTEEASHRPLPEAPDGATAALGERPVIVAAGGGRGITAVVLRELARRTRPTVWILGRTDPSEVPDHILSAADAEQERLRARFLLGGRETGERPLDLARRFERHWRARDVVHNLRELRPLCEVHYVPRDVTDPAQVEQAVDRIRAEGRAVDLLLHSARSQESATVPHKSLAGFRACVAAKVTAYRNLRAAFADQPPRIWINFGSVVSLLGLHGETDYTAANEFLAAAARHESRRHNTTELTLGWGLWEDSGAAGNIMARERLTANGLRSGITDSEGIAHFLAELATGRPAEAAPVFGPADQLAASGFTPAGIDGPAQQRLLGEPNERSQGSAEWRWCLDPVRDRYLTEHLVGGRLVLPGAVMVAMAVETAQWLLPDRAVSGLRDVSFEDFALVDAHIPGPTKYRIRAEVTDLHAVTVEILSDIVDNAGVVRRRDRRHARLVVVTGTPVPPTRFGESSGSIMEPTPISDPYTWPGAPILLTGVFRNVMDLSASAERARARWQAVPAPLDAISHTQVPVLLFDALLRLVIVPRKDGSVQLKVPVRIARIDLFAPGSDAELAARHPSGVLLHRQESADKAVYTATTQDGRTLLAVHGFHAADYGAPVSPPPQIGVPVPMTSGLYAASVSDSHPSTAPEPPNELPYYEWTHMVTFGDTSATGIVYYAELLNWIGHCREQWAFQVFPEYMRGLATGKTLMLTNSVHLDYLGEMWPNDQVIVRMSIPWLRMHFMCGTFRIYRHTTDGPRLVATGEQTWANAKPGAAGEITPTGWQPEVIRGLTAMGTDISRAWTASAKPDPGPSDGPEAAALAFAARKALHWIRCFDLDRDDIVHRADLILAADRYAAVAHLTGDSDLAAQLRASLHEVWDAALSPNGVFDKTGVGVQDLLGRIGTMFADPDDPGIAAIMRHGTLCFEVFDRDQDGLVSEGEYASVMHQVLSVPEEFSITAFRHADQDGDRQITAADWTRLFTEFYTGTDPESPAANMLGRVQRPTVP